MVHVYLFTSPTCPVCPPAKKLIKELHQERQDFDYEVLSTADHNSYLVSEKLGIRSVPTFIITRDNGEENIGLIGSQTKDTLNKYLDVAMGKQPLEQNKPSLRQKFKEGIKVGKLRIKF